MLLLKGSGPTVNKFDEICRSLTLCMRCVEEDNIASSCDPSNVTYVTPMNIVSDEQMIQLKCSELNPSDECAQNTCCCEMDLLAELLEALWGQIKYDDTYLHENGWDREENCANIKTPSPNPNPNPGVPKTFEAVCCGKYPNRHPYRMENGQDCCENSGIYNPLLNECCDNQVRDLGSCQ